MVSFFTTPIFYLTPYIFLWSIANGFIAAGLVWILKLSRTRTTLISTAATTAIASIIWNWSIEFNQSTIYLNVDHYQHEHTHDQHHQHDHPEGILLTEPHTHTHEHLPIKHRHSHYTDIHHLHSH